MTVFTINASSSPVYDSWGFGDYWGCNEWMEWYKQLRTVYGEKESNYIWSKAWLDGVSSVSGGNGTATGSNYITDSVPIDCRTFNSSFRDFLSKNPDLYGAVYSGLGGLIAKPLGLGVDVVNGVVSFGSSAVKTATNTGKVLQYAIPVVIAALLIFILIFTFKYTNKKIQST